MFTGLVEARGTVVALESRGNDVRLTLALPAANGRGEPLAGDVKLGDSVSLNGCCLTVVEVTGDRWAFEAGRETLSRTNLGTLAAGDAVNVERALPADGRLGGHLVQGHVDGTGTVAALDRDGEWLDFTVDTPLAVELVEKGSVAVDGVSLTVARLTDRSFTVALIPHTLGETTLGDRGVGDAVNLETDILGKYVRRFLQQVR